MLPYLTTENGVLFQADCLEFLGCVRSNSVDTVFADPPFNLGKDYKNGFNDNVDTGKYFEWCKGWIFECARVLRPGGALFIYATPELAIRFASYIEQRLTFRHWIALTMKGTYPRGRKLYPAHYALLHYTRGEMKTFNKLRLPVATCRHCGGEVKDYGGHRDKLNPEGLNLTDFWDDTSPNRHKRFKVRPGVNELKLIIPERAILISTNVGEVILDPFGGGGSTFQAAEAHGRRWLGSELHDCAHIRTRFEDVMPICLHLPSEFDWRALLCEDNRDEILWRSTGEGGAPRPGSTLP